MGKNLRRKFILISMSSVTIAIILIITFINIINFVKVEIYCNQVLNLLCEGGGEFPKIHPDKNDLGGGITQETPFQVRYFTITVDDSGKITSLNMNKIATITPQEVDKFLSVAQADRNSRGGYKDYKYAKITKDGQDVFIFLNYGRTLFVARTSLFYSVVVGAIGICLIFVFVVIFAKHALKPVEESYIKQRSFITNASHDIKTPLTVIGAESDIIDMEYGENEYTKEIKNQIAKLNSLTDKLVLLSRMEEDVRFEFEKFDLSQVISDLIKPFSALAKSKNFEFTQDIEVGAELVGNRDLISQMVGLILDNALKYTKQNGKIKVSLKKGKNTELIFENDVEEIELGKHNELFERFYRGDKSRDSSISGNGIGLSVVKAIVDMHRGKITVQSDDGKSVKFVIVL